MIKKSRKIIASFLMVLSLVSIIPTVNAFADTKSDQEFIKKCTETKGKDGKKLYEKDGMYYIYGSDANYMPIILRSKFVENYYVQDDGSIAINKWISAYSDQFKKNVWRYYDSDGISLKGLQTINGVTYYFTKWGDLGIGWFHDGSVDWHYSNPDGSFHGEGWVQDNGNWYYIYSNGILATKTTTPDGYRVNQKGVCVS